MVDWSVALSTATRLVKPGPEISREGAATAVAELRRCAERAEAYVTEVTGLHAPSGTAPVLVVDRPSWIQANLDGFRQILNPLNDKVAEKLKDSQFDDGQHRSSDHRHRGRGAAQLSGAEGARSVRPVLPRHRNRR